MTMTPSAGTTPGVVPTGQQIQVRVNELRPNPANPRMLFDRGPLDDLKENIRKHGVLVPLTVYPLAGQPRYGILDGERRFKCCQELEAEGIPVEIPANVVVPPDDVSGVLYMFNIHNYRQQWELMPTALSLEVIMKKLDVQEDSALANLTGLDSKNVRRCKILLSFPRRYQELSLDPDPKARIPSNFWIELSPVLLTYETFVPPLVEELSRDGLTDRFLEKYRRKRIRSVIDLRRILEAEDAVDGRRDEFAERLTTFVQDPELETKTAFDEFVAEGRRTETVLRACQQFIRQVQRAQVEHVVENRHEVMRALGEVGALVNDLSARLEGEDPASTEEH